MAEVVTSPRAALDIVEIADYIAGDNIDIGLRFLDAARRTIDPLAEFPSRGASTDYRVKNYELVRRLPSRDSPTI